MERAVKKLEEIPDVGVELMDLADPVDSFADSFISADSCCRS
jgi:hypothetical protein